MMKHAVDLARKPIRKKTFLQAAKRDFVKNRYTYLLVLPVVAFYIIFHYAPMYGAVIAFKDFAPGKGIWGSPWAGMKHFIDFFDSYYFIRILKNTILLNFYSLVFGFPAPILLALLLNEIRSKLFKRTVQTITYIPHFISIVVICGMIADFCASDGLINDMVSMLGGTRVPYLQKPEFFRTIYVVSGIWEGVGWGSIIYLAALSGIDTSQYEAAVIDGAGRLKQLWHVTLPGIMPTIVILLILRIGHLMSVGFEKVFLLYNPNTYETADVISTFVYRRGLLESNFSFSTAVGLFNSVINFLLIVVSNAISRKLNETSLW